MQDWLLKGGDATVLGKLEGTMGGEKGGYNDHSSKSWIYQALVRMHYKGGFYFFRFAESLAQRKNSCKSRGRPCKYSTKFSSEWDRGTIVRQATKISLITNWTMSFENLALSHPFSHVVAKLSSK